MFTGCFESHSNMDAFVEQWCFNRLKKSSSDSVHCHSFFLISLCNGLVILAKPLTHHQIVCKTLRNDLTSVDVCETDQSKILIILEDFRETLPPTSWSSSSAVTMSVNSFSLENESFKPTHSNLGNR